MPNKKQDLYAVFFIDHKINDVCIHSIFDSKAKAMRLCTTNAHLCCKLKLNEDINALNKEPKWYYPEVSNVTATA